MVVNGAHTEFNLLKIRKASVSKFTKEIKSLSNASSFGLQKARISLP